MRAFGSSAAGSVGAGTVAVGDAASGAGVGVVAAGGVAAVGVVVSVVLLVTYHKVNEFGEGVAALGRVSPFVSLWLPFFGFWALIIWMYYVLAYVPGGQPIGAIEKRFEKVGRWLRRRSGL